jgi:hypothetical protein
MQNRKYIRHAVANASANVGALIILYLSVCDLKRVRFSQGRSPC